MTRKELIFSIKLAEELLARKCRSQLKTFVKEFWDVIIAEDLIWEPHMTVLCDEVQKVYERTFNREEKLYDLIINIPPGSTKSTIVTIMAPAWAWTRDPTLRCITGSYSDALATEHSQKSRDIVTSDKYMRWFPEVRIKDDKGLKTNYETTANGQRFATSVGGTVTGVHAHVITIDDPLNPKQAASQLECKNANNWIDKTLSTRKVDKTVTLIILIMQRLATNDCTGHLKEKQKEKTRHICLPAELSDIVQPVEYREIYTDGLLSPHRMSAVVLQEARIDMGLVGYAGQYGQRPTPEGGAVWGRYFVEVPDHLFPDIAYATQVRTDWDLAYTKEEANSASAYVTSGLYANNIYLFDFGWAWLEFPELIKWMKLRHGPHYIENKGPGKSAKATLKANGIVANEVHVKRDKLARAKDATPVAEAGMVYIKKSMADKLYNDLKQGILFFPGGQFNDLADALSQALVSRSKKGIVVGTPKVEAVNGNSYVNEGGVLQENPLDWI